jgi:hypothetical protein
MIAWPATFLYFFALWYLAKIFAQVDSFETVWQMQILRRIPVGIPYEGHVAMRYLDCVPFPALMATIVYMYGGRWSLTQIVIVGIIGLALSGGMHYTYVAAGKVFPEFVTYNGKMPPAFWAHVLYMGSGFAIVGLFYLCTSQPVPWLVWLTTIYLIVHVTLGVHVIHKLRHDAWFPYHGIMDAGTLAPIFGTIVILSAFTWWALR